jgi:hypothetical protein
MRRFAPALALLLLLATAAAPRAGVWFCGDFETGGLQGWSLDITRRNPPQVVKSPVRKGRYAVRIKLAPGDLAAGKERAELKIGNRELERLHGSQGREMWYGWSLLVPAGFAHSPGGQFQIVGQWHHRPIKPKSRGEVAGPPPLALRLSAQNGRSVLTLVGRDSPAAPTRTLGTKPVRPGVWTDIVLHVRWSAGSDGFVEAWLDGRPFTEGRQHGPTLYDPASNNYLRLGLYRGSGFNTTNHVFYDEVRIGASYQAVAP